MSGRALSLRDWALLVAASLALFLPGFATVPPVDRDEARYAVASSRMADTGDFIDIRFQEQPRYLQPAGIYWLQSAAAIALDSPAHDSIWAYRVPSLLGALASVLITAGIGTLLFGRAAGLAGAIVLAACFSLNFEARIAKTDAALLAAIAAGQFALLRAYIGQGAGRANAAIFWAAQGVGLLIKGPIILIVSGSTMLALAIWDRRIGWLSRLRPLWGPAIMLAIALPWFIAIGVITDGEFYARSLGRNLMGKVGVSQQGHSGPPGYHLALFIFAFWPGALLALRAIPFVWRERAQPGVRFLICWLAPTWIIFELVATKLPHYVLPTYPAIACLAAAALFADAPAPSRLGRAVFAALCAVWLCVSALLSAASPLAMREMEAMMTPLSIVFAGLTFAAALTGVFLLWTRRHGAAVGVLAISALAAWGNMFGHTLPRLDSMWMSPAIAAAARAAAPCPGGALVTTPYSEPSLVFIHGRERTRIAADGSEAAEAFARAGACALALVGEGERAAFLSRAAALGIAPHAAGAISGRNYSNGDDLNLTFYRLGARD